MIRINLLGQIRPKAARRPVDTGAALPVVFIGAGLVLGALVLDRKSTRLNSSHGYISYAVFCLKKKNYMSHQWPYPSSLVIECAARALYVYIIIDRSALVVALWFDRADGDLLHPREPPGSIFGC